MASRRLSSRPIRFSERVALAARGFLVDLAELLFGDVAVIALQLLLGAQLHAEVGQLALAALAVLAGAVFAVVDRGLRAAPDIFAQTAVDLVLGRIRACSSHFLSKRYTRSVDAPGEGNAPSSALRFRRLTGLVHARFADSPRDTSNKTGPKGPGTAWSILRMANQQTRKGNPLAAFASAGNRVNRRHIAGARGRQAYTRPRMAKPNRRESAPTAQESPRARRTHDHEDVVPDASLVRSTRRLDARLTPGHRPISAATARTQTTCRIVMASQWLRRHASPAGWFTSAPLRRPASGPGACCAHADQAPSRPRSGVAARIAADIGLLLGQSLTSGLGEFVGYYLAHGSVQCALQAPSESTRRCVSPALTDSAAPGAFPGALEREHCAWKILPALPRGEYVSALCHCSLKSARRVRPKPCISRSRPGRGRPR